jgi:hypothetical protein
MVCDTCRRAGQYNAEGETGSAAFLHSDCEYPSTCTCQHVTGEGNLRSEEDKR